MKFSGNIIEYEIFGGSHEEEIGILVKNLPQGFKVDFEKLQTFLERRAPGKNKWSTQRKEADIPIFEYGIEEDSLTGTPLKAIIKNTNVQKSDYKNIMDIPRPGHADFTAYVKYKNSLNMSGGGPFSGRMTAPLCILGGICLQILEEKGIYIGAHITQIGDIKGENFDPVTLSKDKLLKIGEYDFPVSDENIRKKMTEKIEEVSSLGDSIGGIAECGVIGLPAGLGGPMTEGLESLISSIIFSIPAVKGIEFGKGFAAAELKGSEMNDPFIIKDGKILTETNNHGGILGGISSGMPLIFRAAIKPTPSISVPQKSVSLSKLSPETLVIKGRHDPCIVQRAIPVIEAASAIAILDALILWENIN